MRTARRLNSLLRVLAWLLLPLCCAAPVVAAPLATDFLMDSDPPLDVPQAAAQFDPALKTLWLKALARPEIDMQRMAAETIARAHQFGVPDLMAAVPTLEKILVAESSHPAARFAAARALIVLESRSSSEQLWSASQAFGTDLRQLVEPALADWGYAPAGEVWAQRLAAEETRPRELVLAIRGLAHVGEQAALPRLLSIAGDMTRDADLRLEAAAAIGRIADSGLEQDAARFARNTKSPLSVNQICAVRFLVRRDTAAARRLLSELAGHSEPVVAAAALQRLNEIDSALVVPLAESAMNSPDAQVRLQGATAYLNLPSVERIAPLSALLADAHPGIRRAVAAGLWRLAGQPELNERIRESAMQVLAADRWQGQEQAALLLGTLEHKPAADRLVQLLESPRPEVMTTSAWALRRVAVPETIPALIDKATRQAERWKQERPPEFDVQLAHLFEALGVLKATEGLPLLLQYVPKQPSLGANSRTAAIWAIGRIKAGVRDAELETALVDRITDFADKPMELESVKEMSVVALVRMNAADQAPLMRTLVMTSAPMSIQTAVAVRWAVKELVGEELPPPDALPADQGDWFLEPLP